MTSRSDIIDGTQSANLNLDRGLIYTCKCGWIDLGHVYPSNSRPTIGAENLWRQLVQEARTYVHPCELLEKMPKPVSPMHFINSSVFCALTKTELLPGGAKGFVVRYRQDAKRYHIRAGVEKKYIVKFGLTTQEKKRVALAIMKEVSLSFEDLQQAFSLISSSGYSQEDLVSNLISFYIGTGEYTQEQALKLCHPVSQRAAYKIWDTEGPVGSHKNYSWQPQYAASTYRESTNQCIDECALVKKEFPKEFQKIIPAPIGSWHIGF
jgi:hypothetical protein